MSAPTGSDPGELTLTEDEARAVAEVAAAYAAAVPPGREGPYHDLVSAAENRVVTGAAVATLERVCVLALETGKARQLGRAETERLLNAVYRRTPGGQALTAETTELNRVLAQLSGRILTSAKVQLRMPGRYLLDLAVEGFELQISIEPEGLEVRSLQTG